MYGGGAREGHGRARRSKKISQGQEVNRNGGKAFCTFIKQNVKFVLYRCIRINNSYEIINKRKYFSLLYQLYTRAFVYPTPFILAEKSV